MNNDELLDFYEKNNQLKQQNGRLKKGIPMLILHRHKKNIIELLEENVPKTLIYDSIKQKDQYVNKYISFQVFLYFVRTKIQKSFKLTDEKD